MSDRVSRRTLEELRRIANSRGRAGSDYFLVEGERINLRALRASVVPRKLMIAESVFAKPTPEVTELLALVGSRAEIVTLADEHLMELSEGRNSGRVVGVFSTGDQSAWQRLTSPGAADDGLTLVLVDVEEPGNVGALVRTALAGFANLVVCVGVTDPFHPKAVRTSMGSLFRLPVVRVPELQPVLDATVNCRRVAAVATGGMAPWDVPPGGPTALFVGNEARGLPPGVFDETAYGVTIPMPQQVDSYSVNAATAILLYELGARAHH